MMKPCALILHANGTNRDLEAAQAFNLAGAQAEVIHLSELLAKRIAWSDYQLLVIPGGFSYADTLGAGKILALELNSYFADELAQFVADGKPVIGICNGFQTLVKAGLLPALSSNATLTFNAHGQFECRWVTLLPQSKHSLWTRDLAEPIYCPVAHGEGRFLLADSKRLNDLITQQQIAFTYADQSDLTSQNFPYNPNGSLGNIAGVCNPAGNVLGLMPHPEDHVLPYQHPQWSRGKQGRMGLALFANGVRFAAQMG